MDLGRLKKIDLNEFRNIDFNHIGSAPIPVKAALIILIGIAVLAGGYYFNTSHQLTELQRLKQQEQTLKRQFTIKAQRSANLDAYKNQLAEMRRSFGKMLRQLPDKTEIPGLLVDISQAALSNGLQLDLFQPEPEKRKGFYAIKPIKIQAQGTFLEIAHFVSEVASLPRIVTLSNITMKPAGGKSNIILFSATARTYRYLSTEKGIVQ